MLVPENSGIVYGGIGIRGETKCRIESEMHACVSFQPKSRIVGNMEYGMEQVRRFVELFRIIKMLRLDP